MKVIILAAGYATRLYPLTKNWPKPLLLVKEQPIVSHILKGLENLSGVDEVILVSNNNYYEYFREWKDTLNSPLKVTIVNDGVNKEKEKLGAIGDINFVINNVPAAAKNDLLVIGGDNLFRLDLKKFVEFAGRKDGCSIGLYRIEDAELIKQYGVVDIDDDFRIVKFEEKPENPTSDLISMCVYYFPKKGLELMREYIRFSKSHDRSGDYIKWLMSKTNVWGYELKGTWYDIGDIVTFYHASIDFQG